MYTVSMPPKPVRLYKMSNPDKTNPKLSQVFSIGSVLGKRKYPAIPVVHQSVESLERAVEAIKQRSEIQSRETGSIRDSYVSVQDLINVGIIKSDGTTILDEVREIKAILLRNGIT